MPPELVYEIQGERIAVPLESDEVTIGRSADNDVVIRDALVSRHHAKIHRVGKAWRVTDLGSSNGTKVNNADPSRRDLSHGDRIQLHKFPMMFLDGPMTPSVSLTLDSGPLVSNPTGGGTVIRSAVNFADLASMQRGESIEAGTIEGADRLGHLLEIVTRASEALLSSTSLDETLTTVIDLVFEHLKVDRGCILLWDPEKHDLVVRCVKQKGGHAGEITFSRTIADKVYKEKVAILTSDAMSDDRFAGGQSIIDMNIRSAMAAPLWSGDKVDGLIYADTPARVRAFDHFDLDVLSALGNHAAVAIHQSRMQASIMEQQLARQRLERYHSPAVIEHITTQCDSATTLVADEMEVTVMFADVVEFTKLCESMRPKEIADLLNRYFSEMADVVFRHDGTLDKFIGDCMMAVFGAPMRSNDHAMWAVEAALEMREALEALNEHELPERRLRFRIGMHSGRVVAGDIGSVRRSDYTVLGSTVNLAARLESAVAQAGQIVVSDATNNVIDHAFETRYVGDYQPKGISRKVGCYELLSRKG